MVEVLLGHILGDFYFQNEVMAKRKETNLHVLLVHFMLYAVGYFIVLLIKSIVMPIQLVDVALIIVLIFFHAITDFLKFYYGNNVKMQYRFYLDQILHLLSMLFVYSFFLKKGYVPLSDVRIQVLTLVLLVLKPLNILVNQMIQRFNPGDDISTIEGAGAYIGMTERFLFIIFLLMNQFAGIAVVLSIKSFARYKKVAEQPAFAEYFAIGTFTSLLLTLITYYLLMHL